MRLRVQRSGQPFRRNQIQLDGEPEDVVADPLTVAQLVGGSCLRCAEAYAELSKTERSRYERELADRAAQPTITLKTVGLVSVAPWGVGARLSRDGSTS